jgi:ribonuclease HI
VTITCTGVAGFRHGHEITSSSEGLGTHAEVYDGEMAALATAAYKAMSIAKDTPTITHIYFFADNSAAVDGIFDPMMKPGQLYAALFHKATCEFMNARPTNRITVSWIPSHTKCGIKGNDRADELAKNGTELHPSPFTPFSFANAKRTDKEKTQTKWRKEWAKKPKVGRFAPANRIPPSLKPTKHFNEMPDGKEIFSRVTQCRTGHAFIGEYYEKFVPTESIHCPCGEHRQTRDHILRSCTKYAAHRHILIKASPGIYLPDILGTHKGIMALAEFLSVSGAFTKTGNPRGLKTAPAFEDEPEIVQNDDEDYDDDEYDEPWNEVEGAMNRIIAEAMRGLEAEPDG